ncbi:hypothetical protein NE850_11340 [Paraburkholderia sp. USG1]|nr:hypothetical protein [Paraburkholderia sp. USG1]
MSGGAAVVVFAAGGVVDESDACGTMSRGGTAVAAVAVFAACAPVSKPDASDASGRAGESTVSVSTCTADSSGCATPGDGVTSCVWTTALDAATLPTAGPLNDEGACCGKTASSSASQGTSVLSITTSATGAGAAACGSITDAVSFTCSAIAEAVGASVVFGAMTSN